MRRSCVLAVMVATAMLNAPAAFGEPVRVQLFANQDFEEGLNGWRLWPKGTTTLMDVDTDVAHSGEQSLRLKALHTEARGYANASSVGEIEPGVVYRVSLHVRMSPGLDERAVRWRINYRDADDAFLTGARATKLEKTTQNGWTRWSGLFLPDHEVAAWQFIIGIDGGTGTLWIDDITIENLGRPATEAPDVWHYNPMGGVEVGPEPYQRFVQHKEANDAAYRMAGRYNRLLNRTAKAERRMLDIERQCFYRDKPTPPAVRERFNAMEDALNDAWHAFGDGFASEKWQRFTTAADMLEARIDALRNACDEAAVTTKLELPLDVGPVERDTPAVNGDGTLNRLFFGAWSPPVFAEFEQPFGLEFHSSAPGVPRTHTPEQIDFGNVTRACREIEQLGYRGTFGYLKFGMHGQMYAPDWFIERHADDPDVMLTSWDGKRAKQIGSRGYPLNWFHPAVRDYIRDYCGAYAGFCRDEPRILFYEICQETTMKFSAGGGNRTPGYGPHARRAFRNYLRDKYASIDALNAAWGSDYAAFNAIEQPPDRHVQPRDKATPLTAEFEAFSENGFIDYLKLAYDSIKAADPDTPVSTRHSLLLRQINVARIFDTCDIVGAHSSPDVMQLLSILFSTMLRYRTGSAGWMEHGWAMQEERHRFDEEVVMRRAMFKNIARSCAWGRTTQMVWYGYTNARYLTRYNANWFNPRYDVLTLRYSAPGLGVVVERLRQLDWVLTHSEIAASEICLIQPSAAMRNQHTYGLSYDEMLRYHKLLYDAGIHYDALPEEFFVDGSADLSPYEVVILPCATFLPARLQRMLAEFVHAGGTIIATQPPGMFDEIARPSDALLPRLFPDFSAKRDAKNPDLWKLAIRGEPIGETGFVSAKARTGRVIIAPAPLSQVVTGEAQTELLRDVIRSRVTQLAKIRLADDPAGHANAVKPRLDVVPRVTEDGHLVVFIVNADVDRTVTGTIEVHRAAERVVDISLPTPCPAPVERDGDTTSIPIRLAPGDLAALLIE